MTTKSRLYLKTFALLLWLPTLAVGEVPSRVVDITTRPGVTQRFIYLKPDQPKSAVILFAGGDGGIGISDDGHLRKGGNFLVRSRSLFAEQGAAVAVVDAPSDRQSYPFLAQFRESEKHAADIRAVIAWLRKDTGQPVWLIGTSRGTISAAYVATALPPGAGPDGIVLTSTVLNDHKESSVPDMKLSNIQVPILVVHHENDGCHVCQYSDMPRLTRKLPKSVRHEVVTFTGGKDQGNPCQPRAFHGFNGIESEVVSKIMSWIHAPSAKPSSAGMIDVR